MTDTKDVLIALLLNARSIYGMAESLNTLPSAGTWWKRVSLSAPGGLPVALHWWASESILLLKVFPARCFSGDILPAHEESREKIALKLVGISFLILAAYVAFEAIKSLLAHEPPQTSLVGIGLSSSRSSSCPSSLAQNAGRPQTWKAAL